jgi:hypothetical protein
MAEGAAILTTTGNKRFFENMAAASYRLAPERLYNVHGHGLATIEHVNKTMEIFTRL